MNESGHLTGRQESCENYYKFGRTLGQGTFATVKMATCIADNTKWVIIIIYIHNNNNNNNDIHQ